MQGQPATATLDEVHQRVLLGSDRAKIARVGDQQVGTLKSVERCVVFEDPGAHLLPLGERVEQLQPGVVEVVPLPAAHQHGVQSTGGPSHHTRTARG